MTAKKIFDEVNIRIDKAAAASSKQVFQINGLSRFYSRNEDLIHETNSERRFRECFQIRVNEHFTPEDCYRINTEKYKICQVVYLVDQSKIIELNEKKRFYKESRFSYIRPVDGVTR